MIFVYSTFGKLSSVKEISICIKFKNFLLQCGSSL